MWKRFLPNILFLLVFLGICALIGYQYILFYRPQSIHQWAQCDRASVAYNYFQYGFHFFTPMVHNISNGTGITGLEFPLINFLSAVGYAIFGFHEYIYRSLVLLLLALGLFNAFRLAVLLLDLKIISALLAYLLFASPILAYYGISFLSEPASLGLSLSGWYYFFKWKKDKFNTTFITVIVLCLTACLIKVSSLINPLAMAALLFLSEEKPFSLVGIKSKLIRIIPFLLILLPVTAWYIYASFLNTKYNAKVFMLEIRPVTSREEFVSIWKEIERTWIWRFYPRIYFIILSIATLIIFIIPKKIDKPLLTITCLLYAGAISFFLLMYSQFRIHDYYVIPLMPAFFFHWLLIIKQFSLLENTLVKKSASTLFFALVCFVTSEARDHVQTSHTKSSFKYSPMVYDRYFFFEPELRKLNIQPEDKVVSIYDISFTISLYLMNQRGITMGPLTPNDTIIKELQNPLYKYAILNNFNPNRFDPVMDSLHLGKKMLEWNDLTVYKLHE